MRSRTNGITTALLAAASKEIPWHTTRGVEGVGQVSRVVAECVCSVRLTAEGMAA
jgi:hypothetical protein